MLTVSIHPQILQKSQKDINFIYNYIDFADQRIHFINMTERFTEQCPGCGEKMSLRNLACTACGIKIEGEIPLPVLARLAPEEREFVEVFVLCGGSLKDAGQVLGVSYPTVRTRLDQVILSMKALTGQAEETRMSVLDKLEKGEITAKEAGQRLRLLQR